jgi:hypothetical protein
LPVYHVFYELKAGREPSPSRPPLDPRDEFGKDEQDVWGRLQSLDDWQPVIRRVERPVAAWGQQIYSYFDWIAA